ncbi:hypothetical protein MCOR33_011770 [Pyricularia grisea]|uniref:CCHC-type domain-containing protein n=1 Tax=Pyricularia grisea TaxID=148305 RepID=A0ABQ8N1M5_PYRGI|nr:hypothetical protein MCOR33_011770 [Pyricularia grisea]
MLEKELAQQIAQFGRRPNESLKKYLERAQNLNFRLISGDRDKTNRDNLALNLIMRLPDGTDGVTFQQRALDVLRSTGKMTWKGSFLTAQATFKNVYEVVESMVEGLTPHEFPDYTEFDEKDVRGDGEDLTILADNFGRLRINLHQAPPGAQDSGSARQRDDSWRQRQPQQSQQKAQQGSSQPRSQQQAAPTSSTRRTGGTCWNCGEQGHMAPDCPKPYNRQMYQDNAREFQMRRREHDDGAARPATGANAIDIGERRMEEVQTMESDSSLSCPREYRDQIYRFEQGIPATPDSRQHRVNFQQPVLISKPATRTQNRNPDNRHNPLFREPGTPGGDAQEFPVQPSVGAPRLPTPVPPEVEDLTDHEMDEDNGDPVPPLEFDRRNKDDLKRLAQTFADLKADRRDIQKIIRKARQAAQPERRKTVGKGARPKHARPLPIRGVPDQTDDFNFLEELTQTKISVPIMSIIRGMPSAHWDLQQALKMKNKSDDTRANLVQGIPDDHVVRGTPIMMSWFEGQKTDAFCVSAQSVFSVEKLKVGTEYALRSDEVRAPMFQYLEMTLNNHHTVYAMADTGSTIDLIPPALVEELGLPTGKIEEPWNVKFANGTTQPVTQFATVSLQCGHVVVPILLWVMGGPGTNTLLLGQNFFNRVRAILNMGSGSAVLHDRHGRASEVKFLSQYQDHVPSRRDKGVEVVPAPHAVPKDANRRVRFEGDSDATLSEDEEDDHFREDDRDVMLIKEAMKAKKGKVQRQGLYPASLTTPRHY